MYHLSLKGDHYEMGAKRGRIFVKNNITFPLRLDPFQLEHGKESEALLRTYFPEVCEEIRGVSDTIGADYLPFASWMLCMGCCMYNLEYNYPMEIRGCTAFAYSRNGNFIYGRNNDLPPCLRDGCKSEIYALVKGYSQIRSANPRTSSFSCKKSYYGRELCEGIYLRWDEDGWLKERAKLVRDGFRQSIGSHWQKRTLKVNRVKTMVPSVNNGKS